MGQGVYPCPSEGVWDASEGACVLEGDLIPCSFDWEVGGVGIGGGEGGCWVAKRWSGDPEAFVARAAGCKDVGALFADGSLVSIEPLGRGIGATLHMVGDDVVLEIGEGGVRD